MMQSDGRRSVCNVWSSWILGIKHNFWTTYRFALYLAHNHIQLVFNKYVLIFLYNNILTYILYTKNHCKTKNLLKTYLQTKKIQFLFCDPLQTIS